LPLSLASKQRPRLFTSGLQAGVVLLYDVRVNSPAATGGAERISDLHAERFRHWRGYHQRVQDGWHGLPNTAHLALFCAGLEAVNPPVTAGSQAASSPLSNTVNLVTVTIGKEQGKLLFAGLAPSRTSPLNDQDSTEGAMAARSVL
jgi:hypothetical protein